MYCINCGEKILEGNIYCRKCGFKIDNSNYKQRFSKLKVIIITIIVTIVLCTLIGAFIVYFKNNTENLHESSNITTKTNNEQIQDKNVLSRVGKGSSGDENVQQESKLDDKMIGNQGTEELNVAGAEQYKASAPYQIPTWYNYDYMVVKGNQICIAFDDFLFLLEDDVCQPMVQVFTFENDILIDESAYIFFKDTIEAQDYIVNALYTYDEKGKNNFGVTQGEEIYTYYDNIIACGYPLVEDNATMNDIINEYAGYGWEILYQ